MKGQRGRTLFVAGEDAHVPGLSARVMCKRTPRFEKRHRTKKSENTNCSFSGFFFDICVFENVGQKMKSGARGSEK